MPSYIDLFYKAELPSNKADPNISPPLNEASDTVTRIRAQQTRTLYLTSIGEVRLEPDLEFTYMTDLVSETGRKQVVNFLNKETDRYRQLMTETEMQLAELRKPGFKPGSFAGIFKTKSERKQELSDLLTLCEREAIICERSSRYLTKLLQD